jgi:outer membrane protein OmpA-like peptidoglycan-associated protein
LLWEKRKTGLPDQSAVFLKDFFVVLYLLKMNWIRTYILIFILGFSSAAYAQRAVADFLNFSEINSQEITSLEALNSKEIEFAPGFFRDGMLFVQANSEKKRIKMDSDIHFRLMYTELDQAKNYTEPIVFDSIFTEDAFEGPFCYVPQENLLMVTRNQSSMHESDEAREMKLGIYFYSFSENQWKYSGKLPFNNKDFNVCHPAYDPESGTLIFASDRPGGFGGLDLYSIHRISEEKWSDPVNLGEFVNSPGNDCFPFIHDGEFLFFSSDREAGAGALDIYASVYEEGSWLKSEALPEPVNGPSDDLGLIVSESGRDLYFSSSRRGGMGRDDLYHIQLELPVTKANPGFHIVQVFENARQNPLPEAELRFYKFEKKFVEVVKDANAISGVKYGIDPQSLKGSKPVFTNKNGEVSISLGKGEYIMEASKENYYDVQQLVKIERLGEIIKVAMDSITCKNVELVIRHADTEKRLEGAEIYTDKGLVYNSDSQGIAPLCVSGDKTMLVKIRKEGFQEFDVILDYDLLSIGEQVVIALRPSKIFVEELPVYSGEFTVLENILYEYNRSDLNEQARGELDRLAEHMITYPAITIELSAHTDSRGGEVYNQVLSDDRARKAKEYLMEKGIANWRIAAIGYGESRLRNSCSDGVECTENQHAINRRTEVRVIAGHNGN